MAGADCHREARRAQAVHDDRDRSVALTLVFPRLSDELERLRNVLRCDCIARLVTGPRCTGGHEVTAPPIQQPDVHAMVLIQEVENAAAFRLEKRVARRARAVEEQHGRAIAILAATSENQWRTSHREGDPLNGIL